MAETTDFNSVKKIELFTFEFRTVYIKFKVILYMYYITIKRIKVIYT